MAATTLAAILARFEAVCEAEGLTAAVVPFTHDRQPNLAVTLAYYIEDAGLSRTAETTDDTLARIDRLTIWIAHPINFAGSTSRATLHATLDSVESAICADGLSHSYHARLEGRRVTRPNGRDLWIASLAFSVDYDRNL